MPVAGAVLAPRERPVHFPAMCALAASQSLAGQIEKAPQSGKQVRQAAPMLRISTLAEWVTPG